MEVVAVPDSHRESLSTSEVAQTIEKGFREIFPDAQYVSISATGGGEGTVGAIIAATQGVKRHAWVTGPLGEKVSANRGISGDGKTAFTEMVAANGLELIPAEGRDPLAVTSRGTGESVLQALESGATSVIVDIGGSTTSDGGAGAVQVLGAKLYDANGNEIGFGGGSLSALNDINISGPDPRLKGCVICIACDVTGPLAGDGGASHISGPQKGASEAMTAELDNNLSHCIDVTKKALHVDVKDTPGVGVAGGMSMALTVFLGVELESGTEIVTMTLSLEEHIRDCTLVITDEGRIDSQSIHGKIPVGITNTAKKYHEPVIGIVSSLTSDVGVVYRHDIDAVFSVLTGVGTLDEALHGAYDSICHVPRNIVATLAIGIRNAG